MKLSERKLKILKAIIDNYVSTAEPVGSRTVAKKYNLGISPATIRNEMADLEEMGYIKQPHTSAGRVPSDKGYRLYVDSLMEVKQLSKDEIDKINQAFKKKVEGIENVVLQTSKILSDMTDYASIVLGPHLTKSTLKRIQILYIEQGKALIVIVTNTGLIESKLMGIPKTLTESDLVKITNLLNEELSGLSLDEINNLMIKKIRNRLFGYEDVLELTMRVIISSYREFDDSKIYFGGTPNLFKQPEFMDMEKVRKLLCLFEEKNLLMEIMMDAILDEDLAITIGSENKYEEVKSCSLITATYKLNGKIIGRIGVLGPTRMNYSRVISVLNFLTKQLSMKLKSHLEGE